MDLIQKAMKNPHLIIVIIFLLIPIPIFPQFYYGNAGMQSDTNNGDWTAQHVILYNTPEADMMVRTGDIDNVSFGWPTGFDPFSGQSTPAHGYPWTADTADAMGTDRIMVITSYVGSPPYGQDGYTSNTSRPENLPRPIKLFYPLSGMTITTAAIQIFVDDFQAPVWGANYFVTVNGHDIPNLAVKINSLVQTGPIGKMITYVFPQDQLYMLVNDSLNIFFDDTTTGAGDGYAIDFVKLLINLQGFAYTGNINGYVTDLNSGFPIQDARVVAQGFTEVLTDENGYYELNDVPAGINYIQATKFGFDTASSMVDLLAGQTIQRDFTIKEVLDAEFSADPLTGVYPLPVQFTDLSTQNPTDWHWNFGDGDTSNIQNPQHTYANDAVYTVKLTASNGIETNTEIKLDYIQVGTFGINEIEYIKNFQIYPNPILSTVFIEYNLEKNSLIKIEIFNSQGKMLEEILCNTQPRGKHIIHWDAEYLPAGIYYIRIQAQDQRSLKKIVKLR